MKYRRHPGSASARLGPDRNLLEATARQIMARNLHFHTQLGLPEMLSWYLYRGRFLFKGEPTVSRSALCVLREAYKEFVAAHATSPGSAHLPAAFLDDVANVLRTGGWTLRASFRMAFLAFCPFLPQAAFRPACLMSTLKVFLLPITVNYHLRDDQ
jgi:hypothetical protein